MVRFKIFGINRPICLRGEKTTERPLMNLIKIGSLLLCVLFGLSVIGVSAYTLGYRMGFKGALHDLSLEKRLLHPDELIQDWKTKRLQAWKKEQSKKRLWVRKCTVKGQIIALAQPRSLIVLGRHEKERTITMTQDASYKGVNGFENLDLKKHKHVFIIGNSLEDGNFKGHYLSVRKKRKNKKL